MAITVTLVVPMCLFGQNVKPESKLGIIIGTAVDVNGDPVPNAKVELKSFDDNDRRALSTRESGSFEFRDVQPGVPYELTVNAQDFADWKSSSITLEPGQFKIVTGIRLRVETQKNESRCALRPSAGRG